MPAQAVFLRSGWRDVVCRCEACSARHAAHPVVLRMLEERKITPSAGQEHDVMDQILLALRSLPQDQQAAADMTSAIFKAFFAGKLRELSTQNGPGYAVTADDVHRIQAQFEDHLRRSRSS